MRFSFTPYLYTLMVFMAPEQSCPFSQCSFQSTPFQEAPWGASFQELPLFQSPYKVAKSISRTLSHSSTGVQVFVAVNTSSTMERNFSPSTWGEAVNFSSDWLWVPRYVLDRVFGDAWLPVKLPVLATANTVYPHSVLQNGLPCSTLVVSQHLVMCYFHHFYWTAVNRTESAVKNLSSLQGPLWVMYSSVLA